MTLSFRGSEDTSEDILMRALRNEQKFLARDMTAELEVASVDGSFVIDSHGKRYIDFVMGCSLWSSNAERLVSILHYSITPLLQ